MTNRNVVVRDGFCRFSVICVGRRINMCVRLGWSCEAWLVIELRSRLLWLLNFMFRTARVWSRRCRVLRGRWRLKLVGMVGSVDTLRLTGAWNMLLIRR